MATVVLVYPRDGGTWATNPDNSLVPFPAWGYVDESGKLVSIYEDGTGVLLGSANAETIAEPSGPYAGWFRFEVPITSWTPVSNILGVPTAAMVGAAVAPGMKGTLDVPSASGTITAAVVSITVQAQGSLGVPVAAGTSGAGSVSIKAVLGIPTATGTSTAAAVGITSAAPSAGISYVGAGTVFSGVEGDVPLPAPAGGILADDILIMHGEDLSAADLPPAGWLFKTNGGWDSVYWKRAGASEAAPHIIGPSDGDGSNFARSERIYAFRGCVATGDPFDVTSGAPVLASSGSTATGSALTTLAGSFLGFLVHSLPAATDAGGDLLVTTTFGGGSDSLVYKSAATTAGVQAAPTITLAASGGKTHWTFALKKAP